MDTTAPKIVLDTNVLIACIGRRSPFRWLFEKVIDGQLALCVSDPILYEYREILERKTTAEIAENIINFIAVHPATVFTQIYFHFGLIEADPDDNKFTDCAIGAGAMCIVSNDQHFQVLKSIPFPKIAIMTLSEFEAEFRR